MNGINSTHKGPFFKVEKVSNKSPINALSNQYFCTPSSLVCPIHLNGPKQANPHRPPVDTVDTGQVHSWFTVAPFGPSWPAVSITLWPQLTRGSFVRPP